MSVQHLELDGRQAVLDAVGPICASTQEIVDSEAFARVVLLYLGHLEAHAPTLLADLGLVQSPDPDEAVRAAARERLIELLRLLANNPLERVAHAAVAPGDLVARRDRWHELVEGLYDFWRHWDRFLVLRAQSAAEAGELRAVRGFIEVAETLTRLVRALYRDVAANITAGRPRVYRQVAAGAEAAVYVAPQRWPVPVRYRDLLAGIPFVRDVLLYPPLLLDPPMNTRSGQFTEVDEDPLEGLRLDRSEWLCYPALVGRLTVFVYFHRRVMGLGLSLANLFELASDEEVAAGPDAIYLYGVPGGTLDRFGDLPTVFHEDAATGLLVAAVPLEDRFGYFGYLKKMVLTLHNVAVMRRGLLPFHGACVRVVLSDGRAATLVLIGDTAAGKSETLEALRVLGDARVRELRVVADDMGSLEDDGGTVRAYGTEIGAFVRLDDLQQGYAFGRLDRAIIMSPSKVNARVVLPVTTFEEVLHGHPVDYLLYANNHEAVDDRHPVLERFSDAEEALAVFRDGAAMSRGTTTATGLTHSYFANPFGPAQRREEHEVLAQRLFTAAARAGVVIGQLRTQLGLPGMATAGPEAAAAALLDEIERGARGGAAGAAHRQRDDT